MRKADQAHKTTSPFTFMLRAVSPELRAEHCAKLQRVYRAGKSSPRPHQRVYNVLSERISSLPPGSHIGREVDLCRELNVGKWALRHALELLRADGLVQTIIGQGTFVLSVTTGEGENTQPISTDL